MKLRLQAFKAMMRQVRLVRQEGREVRLVRQEGREV